MSDYRRQTMAANLKIAHISLPPELYEARALVKAAGYALLALPIYGAAALVTMNMTDGFARIIPPALAIVMVVLGVLQYTNSREKISEAIKEKREQIDMDLPRFVYTISQEIQMDHNVLSILEKHKNNFSEYFREELEITIADMRSSNWEAALTRFEGRIGSTHLSEVTRGLIEMVRGSDTHVYWENPESAKLKIEKPLKNGFIVTKNRLKTLLIFFTYWVKKKSISQEAILHITKPFVRIKSI